MTATRKDKRASVYDAPGDLLRSDLPEGRVPESLEPPRPPGYALLRVVRWVLRVVAVIYLLAGLAQAAVFVDIFAASAPDGRTDEREMTYPDSSRTPEAHHWITLSKVRVGIGLAQTLVIATILLALAEAIQLGLDIRAGQQRQPAL